MPSDQELRRRTERKQPRQSALPIGRLLQRYAHRSLVHRRSSLESVKSAVAEVVDGEFMTHCRSLRVQGGALIIEIDDPALAYHYRRKYLFSLREHLARVVPQARIIDIRFSLGL